MKTQGMEYFKKGTFRLRLHDRLNYRTDLFKINVFRKFMIRFWWHSPLFSLISSQKTFNEKSKVQNWQCCLKCRQGKLSCTSLELPLRQKCRFQRFVSYWNAVGRYHFLFIHCFWSVNLRKTMPSKWNC
jgi:hypothetical protein